jgi:hypothetical protein
MTSGGRPAADATPERPLPTDSVAKPKPWTVPGTPSASRAARSPVVLNMTAVPSTDTASAVHQVTIVGEHTRKRRHHVRAVVCGTPRCSAIGRRPRPPPTLSDNAWPITSTSSSRRASTRSGRSAWLRRHAEHRPRRIQIRSTSKRRPQPAPVPTPADQPTQTLRTPLLRD